MGITISLYEPNEETILMKIHRYHIYSTNYPHSRAKEVGVVIIKTDGLHYVGELINEENIQSK